MYTCTIMGFGLPQPSTRGSELLSKDHQRTFGGALSKALRLNYSRAWFFGFVGFGLYNLRILETEDLGKEAFDDSFLDPKLFNKQVRLD